MNELRENYLWLDRFYRPLRLRLASIAIQSVAVGALSAAIPYVYIGIIDGIKTTLSPGMLLRGVLVLFGLGVLHFLAAATNGMRRAQTNIELEWKFRQAVFSHVIRMDRRFYDHFRIGDLMTRFTDDMGRKLSWFACSGIFRAWESLLRVSFCLGAMALIDVRLMLVTLLPVPFEVLLYARTVRAMDTRFRKLQSSISSVTDTIATCFSGIRVIQAYGMEDRQALGFGKAAEERARDEVSAERIHIFVHSLWGLFAQVSQVLVLIFGGAMVIKGSLTVGEYVAFDYYVLFLVPATFDFGQLLTGYRRAAVSIGRLRELEACPPAIHSPEAAREPVPGDSGLVFANVSLRRGDRAALDQISFDTKDHRMVAVVGEVGSGKTTLLDHALRFGDPDSGQVMLGGIPLPQLSLSGLRRRVGYVSQEPLLFSDTVSANIRFGREPIDPARVAWAAGVAQLADDLHELRHGLETPIGLRGLAVSGGQKQRISIARALAGEPDLLVLDDATAHLDAETEAALWDRILDVLPAMRLLVVSHRTATLERADWILVLKDGCLVEQGRHTDLMALRGEYHRIYSRQRMEEVVAGTGVLRE